MKKALQAFIAFAVAAVPLAAQTAAKKPATSPRAATPAAALARSSRPAAPRPSLLNPALLKAKAPEVYKVKVTTTKGDFVVEVNRAWAPLGADRFYNLARNGFYEGAAFFRVLPGFVAQFGIAARPAVGRAWARATIPDDPVTQSNLRGSLTFATAGPNTRTTQIFINLADNPRLDGMGFAPFGRVVEGMDVVDKLFSDYGEGAPRGNGPDQGRLTNEGKAYLDKGFPLLDSIKSAAILGPAAPVAPTSTAKKATAAKTTTATKTAKPATTTKETK
jgi:peptidyl-prolyl cis-trans isomerase A (cyclophilin A)